MRTINELMTKRIDCIYFQISIKELTQMKSKDRKNSAKLVHLCEKVSESKHKCYKVLNKNLNKSIKPSKIWNNEKKRFQCFQSYLLRNYFCFSCVSSLMPFIDGKRIKII